MVLQSFLKYGISNKIDGTDDTLYEDFLSKGVAEAWDVADNSDYVDYYDESPVTFEILDYDWASFFKMILGDFNIINRQKTLGKPILQKLTSTYTVCIYPRKEF